MGASVAVIAFLPWLDRSLVVDGHRGPIYKSSPRGFAVALTLGYLGTQPPSPSGQLISRRSSLVYNFGLSYMARKIDKC